MKDLLKYLPLGRLGREPVFYLTAAGVVIAMLVDALSVPGTTFFQAVSMVVATLIARWQVTPV